MVVFEFHILDTSWSRILFVGGGNILLYVYEKLKGVLLLIHKKRMIPRRLLFSKAILGRLPPNHPVIPLIEEDIRRREAGFIGEQRLDNLLTKLPEKELHIFQGLHLPNEDGSYFQMDTFIYNSSHGLDIEVKNMNNELIIDRKAGQMIQKLETKQIGYEDPLLQAQLQLRQFREWLIRHKLPYFPLEPLVMMSNPNCILRFDNDPVAQYRICRGRQVLYRIEEFEGKYKKEIMTPELMKKLKKLLLKEDFEPFFEIERIFKISRTEIRCGVHCPVQECRHLGMIYHQGVWVCPRCRHKSWDAFLPALRDYFLFYGPEITNQQFRRFLRIGSVHVASKMLRNLGLPSIGEKKYRVYQLPFDIF
jgi:hypothetical protein